MSAAVRQAKRWASQTLRMRSLYDQWGQAAAGKLVLNGRPRALRLRRTLAGAPVDVLVATWQDIRIVNELFLADPYLRRLPERIRARPHPVVVDVGANRGYFCVQAAVALDRPTIVAYEPEPVNLTLLGANLALNGLSASVEVVAAAAVADATDHVTLHLASAPALHTTVSPEDGSAHGIKAVRYSGKTIDVPARNLDRDLARVLAGTGTIDVLKVDTEGTEPALVESLSDDVLAAVQYVVAEVGGPEAELAAVRARLTAAGFNTDVDAVYLYATR